MKIFANPRRLSLCGAVISALILSQPTRAADLTVLVGGDGPAFVPRVLTVQPGDTVNWKWASAGIKHSVTSGTSGTPDGLFDSGIHTDPFTFSHTFQNSGTFNYYCIPHLSMGMTGIIVVAAATPTPSPSPSPNPTPAQPLNISTRMQVLTGDQVLIGGFIITGDAPKQVILRAVGPSLADVGVENPLPDPVLELHQTVDTVDTVLATNDNWKDTQEAAIMATGLEPKDDLESAILRTLDPGSYTAIVSGKNNGTGVGLVEGYDLDAAANSELANISTRGFVDTGANVLIGGFILGGGSENTTVLVRAIGPSLAQFGVSGALADPTLELHDVNGALIQSDDNWKDTQQTEIEATGLQPGDDLESAILEILAPGAYTAIVSGKGDATGVGLVEVYRLP